MQVPILYTAVSLNVPIQTMLYRKQCSWIRCSEWNDTLGLSSSPCWQSCSTWLSLVFHLSKHYANHLPCIKLFCLTTHDHVERIQGKTCSHKSLKGLSLNQILTLAHSEPQPLCSATCSGSPSRSCSRGPPSACEAGLQGCVVAVSLSTWLMSLCVAFMFLGPVLTRPVSPLSHACIEENQKGVEGDK